MNIKSFCIGLGVCCLLWTSSSLAGTVTFGSGETAFDIEFVTVGAPGNAPDLNDPSRPAGGVDYVYRIGKYEISRQIIERANIAGNLGITLQDMTGMGGNGPDKPATGINWFEAARFVNWLNQHDEYPPAYKFVDGQFQLWTPQDSGYDDANPFRNTEARYFLPTFHEWYKAAFYDPRADAYYTYPTGSNRPPSPTTGGTDPETAVYGQHTTTGPANVTQAGGLSPIGTMAQGGNAWEWEETEYDMHNDSVFGRRALRGGSWTNDVNHIARWYRNQFQPAEETWFKSFGFRVASFVESPAGNGDRRRIDRFDVRPRG